MSKELKEYATLVRKMLAAQKSFFKAVPNTPEKREYLELSKKLEKEVEAQTNKILSHQTGLF